MGLILVRPPPVLKTLHFTGVLLLLCLAFAEPLSASDSVSRLQHARIFALGGIGYAGVMSDGERALRTVLKQSDASMSLEAVLPHASVAGQLYALLGLRLRDRAAYARALHTLPPRDSQVETMRGCSVGRESFRELVSKIEHGRYDSSLSRPAWSHQQSNHAMQLTAGRRTA